MQITKPDALKRVLSTLIDVSKQARAPRDTPQTDLEALASMEAALRNASHEDLAYFAAVMSYATSDPIMELQVSTMMDEIMEANGVPSLPTPPPTPTEVPDAGNH